jgi:hypothetical protein
MLHRPNRVDNIEGSHHRALDIILARPRISEIHQNPVAHVFRDQALRLLNQIRDAFVIGGDDFAKILNIKPRGQGGRTD